MVSTDVPDWTQQALPATIVAGVTDLFAVLSASSSGDNDIISAVASKRIVVRALLLTVNAAVNAKWRTSTGSVDITGLAYMDAKGGYVLPYNGSGWFQTAAGDKLQLNLSGAVAVGGMLVYGTV